MLRCAPLPPPPAEQLLPSLAPRDEVTALQTSLRVEGSFERLHLVGELLDSRALQDDSSGIVTNTVVNALEALQAYASWTWTTCNFLSALPIDANEVSRRPQDTIRGTFI